MCSKLKKLRKDMLSPLSKTDSKMTTCPIQEKKKNQVDDLKLVISLKMACIV